MSISTARRVPPQPAAGRWIVVTEECVAAFGVQDKLMGRTHGTMPVVAGGAVVNDGGTVDHAWVELSVAGIATGNAHRDRDLRKPGFLDVEGHPTVRVDVTDPYLGEHGWTATAVLAARGREAPLEVTVTRTAATVSEVRVQVTGRLDRKPLGIKAPTFIVGRFVDIDVDLTMRLA